MKKMQSDTEKYVEFEKCYSAVVGKIADHNIKRFAKIFFDAGFLAVAVFESRKTEQAFENAFEEIKRLKKENLYLLNLINERQ